MVWPRRGKRSPQKRGLEEGYRSGLEVGVADQLNELGAEFTFEEQRLKFVQPEKARTYKPDFIIQTESGKELIVETKGRFTAADRAKHLWVREQNPGRDIRFVFDRSKDRIAKGSKTTYASWCHTNGFLFADKLIPEDWLDE